MVKVHANDTINTGLSYLSGASECSLDTVEPEVRPDWFV